MANTDSAIRLIDVHHHMMPPAYVEARRADILKASSGLASVLEWTPARSLDVMDRNGVGSAVASLSIPGVWFAGNLEQGRRLARESNEYGAKLARDYPGRFGFFAAVPFPDIDGTLAEIAYALDVLKADGIGLFTDYDGKYPGEPEFAPIFDELNRRKAVVFFHPAAPGCCMDLDRNFAPGMLEYPFDTARAIASLLFSATFSRCSNIRFIFSHGGGAIPMVTGRIAVARLSPEIAARIPNGLMYELKRLYVDTASVTNPPAIAAMLKLFPASQVMFGSDYPFRPMEADARGFHTLEFTPDQMKAIARENAAGIFPRLA